MVAFCRSCAPLINTGAEEEGSANPVINVDGDDDIAQLKTCKSCGALQSDTFYHKIKTVCENGEDATAESFRHMIRAYTAEAEIIVNDDIDEGVEYLATLAFAPHHPRYLAPQERLERLKQVYRECTEEPKSKLGKHLEGSPISEDILLSVKDKVNELQEHVTFAGELGSKWDECWTKHSLVEEDGQEFGKMCEECDKLVQNNKHIAGQVITSKALRDTFKVCLDAFLEIVLPNTVLATLPDEEKASRSAIILALSKHSQHIHNLHDECARFPEVCVLLSKYIDAVVQLKNGTEEDLKKMEAGNATNMLKNLRGLQDKGSLIVSSIHEEIGEDKVRCYK